MGRKVGRLPGFCLNHVATRILVRSPSIDVKPKAVTTSDAADREKLKPKSAADSEKLQPESAADSEKLDTKSRADAAHEDGAKQGKVVGRRIMIVVDSSNEAKGAVQWALSHTVQIQDTIVLLSVIKPSSSKDGGGGSSEERDPRGYQLLCSMRNICQAKKPGMEVELSVVEGRERGPAIVEEARKQDASLLVLGQKKRPPLTWRLLLVWASGGNNSSRLMGGGVVDYCIQNASCMAVAVRRRSRQAGGGYLITTKRHKDFWLLA